MGLQKTIELNNGFTANYLVALPFGDTFKLYLYKNRQAKLDGKQPISEYLYNCNIYDLDLPEGETKILKAIKKAIYLKLKADVSEYNKEPETITALDESGVEYVTVLPKAKSDNDTVLEVIKDAQDVLD